MVGIDHLFGGIRPERTLPIVLDVGTTPAYPSFGPDQIGQM
jgi:hypothetical protein